MQLNNKNTNYIFYLSYAKYIKQNDILILNLKFTTMKSYLKFKTLYRTLKCFIYFETCYFCKVG